MEFVLVTVQYLQKKILAKIEFCEFVDVAMQTGQFRILAYIKGLDSIAVALQEIQIVKMFYTFHADNVQCTAPYLRHSECFVRIQYAVAVCVKASDVVSEIGIREVCLIDGNVFIKGHDRMKLPAQGDKQQQ
ncbi:MAG: hypothetical protein QM296_00400 [Bacillota bacterium]|nr:hypothetical protein [Bacillota bacterium]